MDWSALGIFQAYGAGIVPNLLYEIQVVDRGCFSSGDEFCFAASVTVKTPKWADVETPL